MRRVRVENGFRLMLAAWMLVATSITSSTYVHAHSGGKVAHQHDGDDCHRADFSATATCNDDLYTCPVDSSSVDSHRHGCLTLLGTITYHSIPDRGSGSHEKKPCGWETIVAVSAAQTIRAPSKSLLGSYVGLVSQAILSTCCVCDSNPLGFRFADAVPALCDRARHERSGVLLA
jgi:hypothetical protein